MDKEDKNMNIQDLMKNSALSIQNIKGINNIEEILKNQPQQVHFSNNEIMRKQEENYKKMMEASNKARREKIEREKKSIQLQETIIEQNDKSLNLQELEVEFLGSMSEDTSKMVNVIKNLELINAANGKIIEANMLEIEKLLEDLVNNTNHQNIYEIFIEEVKKQMIEKGVNYGLQFLFTGLKTLIIQES